MSQLNQFSCLVNTTFLLIHQPQIALRSGNAKAVAQIAADAQGGFMALDGLLPAALGLVDVTVVMQCGSSEAFDSLGAVIPTQR